MMIGECVKTLTGNLVNRYVAFSREPDNFLRRRTMGGLGDHDPVESAPGPQRLRAPGDDRSPARTAPAQNRRRLGATGSGRRDRLTGAALGLAGTVGTPAGGGAAYSPGRVQCQALRPA